ncbi:MAG: putative tail tip assembly protein I [Prokaryotic dsDNA virus sp.]|nr:MAG: putative tail tip assembly protein I [Prokaryotic dsDNA virus sp.]|tara:strand:+ start:10026 stop:10646 length:621 start_codon:yes stop_codon:yes gene_type:complete
MLRKIKLYGKLAEFVGHKEFEVKVSNISQAISFLVHNFPELECYMSPKYYQVKVGNYAVDEKELDYPVGSQDIHFIPVISGAGKGFGKILLGAALIGVGLMLPGGGMFGTYGLGGAAAVKGGFLTGLGTFTSAIGASLVLQGVSNMLFPLPDIPKFESSQDPKLSFNFNGLQNTSRAGTPVPIVYGEIITGSVVISAAIDTNQVEA